MKLKATTSLAKESHTNAFPKQREQSSVNKRVH